MSETVQNDKANAVPHETLPAHDCLKNLDQSCRCTVCGAKHHVYIDDSAGSGMGRVNVACLRCGKTEAFYDDTGNTIYSDFDDADYSHYGGSRASKEELVRKILSGPGHDCKRYFDALSGKCLLCGKKINALL
jgi:hypothetical protein